MKDEFQRQLADRGRVGYEAYSEHTGGKSLVYGERLPSWNELNPEIKTAWQCAAEAIIFQPLKK